MGGEVDIHSSLRIRAGHGWDVFFQPGSKLILGPLSNVRCKMCADFSRNPQIKIPFPYCDEVESCIPPADLGPFRGKKLIRSESQGSSQPATNFQPPSRSGLMNQIHSGIYGCFLKWWYPEIIFFNRIFQCKPSILGYPYFWKRPYYSMYFFFILIFILT